MYNPGIRQTLSVGRGMAWLCLNFLYAHACVATPGVNFMECINLFATFVGGPVEEFARAVGMASYDNTQCAAFYTSKSNPIDIENRMCAFKSGNGICSVSGSLPIKMTKYYLRNCYRFVRIDCIVKNNEIHCLLNYLAIPAMTGYCVWDLTEIWRYTQIRYNEL